MFQVLVGMVAFTAGVLVATLIHDRQARRNNEAHAQLQAAQRYQDAETARRARQFNDKREQNAYARGWNACIQASLTKRDERGRFLKTGLPPSMKEDPYFQEEPNA